MSEPWDELKDAAASVVKDALKGLVENNRDVEDFVKETAMEYAREYWGSLHAGSEAEKEEHRQNLAHLQSQVKGEALKRLIALHEDAKGTLGSLLETVGGIFLKVAPKILAAAR